MDSEDWKAFRERGQIAKQGRQATNTETISEWCNTRGIEFKALQPYHLRLNIKNTVLDIYPQTKKYHNVTINMRGRIKGTIVDFLNSYL